MICAVVIVNFASWYDFVLKIIAFLFSFDVYKTFNFISIWPVWWWCCASNRDIDGHYFVNRQLSTNLLSFATEKHDPVRKLNFVLGDIVAIFRLKWADKSIGNVDPVGSFDKKKHRVLFFKRYILFGRNIFAMKKKKDRNSAFYLSCDSQYFTLTRSEFCACAVCAVCTLSSSLTQSGFVT